MWTREAHPNRWRERRAFQAAGVGVLIAVVCLLIPATGVADPYDPDWNTRSYYVSRQSTSTLNSLGCQSANNNRKGRMSLLFGSPVDVAGSKGVTLWGGADATIGEVEDLAQAFVRGYHRCADGSISITLGVGAANCLIGDAPDANCDTSAVYKTASWVRDHGAAWGRLTNRLSAWDVNNGYSGRVTIYGAWDMEPDWSSAGRADAWMSGYDNDASGRPIFVLGSADGCPPSGGCDNGWDRQDIYHETWARTPSLPFPQVYYNVNGDQWQNVSEWGYHNRGSAMYFAGSLSHDSINSSAEAHVWLHSALNSHSHTAQADLRWASHMTFSLSD